MAGLVPPAVLEQIRAASDIVDVIGAALPLKRAGANFVTLCPFHREKTPSFNVNPQRQVFHCFGCHKGGDVFTFIREYENVSFMEAVTRLAERARIPLQLDSSPGQAQAHFLKDKLLTIHEQLSQRWQHALANDAAGQVARDYLQARGVSAEAIQLFRLGYAPDSWDDTINWARSKGYDLAVVEQAGLIIRRQESDGYYDRFRGRLMFPICDEQGRVIAFSGRILVKDDKTAKYINSPETPIFIKSKTFYGLDKSKRAILDAGFAVVCEGQLDLIAAYMAGVQNMVAPQGTAFTPEHARVLKRYVNEVVLCFDSDEAGQNAAVRVLDSLLASELAVRVAVMPAPHDPDSYIKQVGADAFAALLREAPGFFDFFLERLCRQNDLGTDKGRLAVVRQLGEALNKTGSPVLLDTYAQKASQRLNVSAEAVRHELKRLSRPSRVRAAPSADPAAEMAPEEAPQQPPSTQEMWLLKVLFLAEDHVPWIAEHLEMAWLKHPLAKAIVAARLEASRENTWQGVAAFLDHFEDPVARSLITAAASESRKLPDLEKVLKGDPFKKGLLELLRNEHIERQSALVQQQLTRPGLSDEASAALLQEKTRLRAEKQRRLGGNPPESTSL